MKVHLIGQIGKNFALKNNLISLELILQETFTIIKEIRSLAGSRFAILECSHDHNLISLYETYDFKKLCTEQDEDNLVTMCIKVPD